MDGGGVDGSGEAADEDGPADRSWCMTALRGGTDAAWRMRNADQRRGGRTRRRRGAAAPGRIDSSQMGDHQPRQRTSGSGEDGQPALSHRVISGSGAMDGMAVRRGGGNPRRSKRRKRRDSLLRREELELKPSIKGMIQDNDLATQFGV
ncbi:hypothetical protein Syun_001679 [Stephania yunnanensis]|uniref:Uncharacterized protein n=1 Tax=Stephania yunnanensis TaxID=152371 RepID=A0AAP0Q802_9MAGN